MKQYIKPTTVVESIVLASMVCTSPGTPQTTNESASQGRGMDTKSRDVWSEGYW